MAQIRVERLDHLGVIASVIQDLGLIGMIDTRLVPDEQEVITPGEAVAAMILNGLGFANRPLSLTPQFFASNPLDLLFRAGINAEMFNRFKLGRTLDEASAYGCDLLFQELALAVCAHEGIDLRVNHLDTTSFSLTGDYIPDSDAHAIRITHGYSKDHRPDLKQAVLELMVSQDGGIPFVSKSWDGNTSDTQVFQQRVQALMSAFKDTPSPRYLVADAKLYCEDNAVRLAKLGFITRIPATLKLGSQVIGQALQWDTWQPFDDNTRYQPLALCHYGMVQRWLVVYSRAALERAEAALNRAQQREHEAITKQLFHLQAQRFGAPQAAQDALAALAKRWKYHRVASYQLTGQNALRADLGNVSRSSRTSSLCSGGVSAPFDHLPLVIDDPVGRVPDVPYPHLTPTMRTDQRVSPRALLVALPVGQPSDDLHRALDHALHLGQGLLNQDLDLGKRLGRLHPVIPDALEPFGYYVLHHAANKRGDIHGFVLDALGAVGAIMVRDPRAIVAIDAPDRNRGAHHILGHVTR
jgi:transposase